jgi:hypothetical protein
LEVQRLRLDFLRVHGPLVELTASVTGKTADSGESEHTVMEFPCVKDAQR